MFDIWRAGSDMWVPKGSGGPTPDTLLIHMAFLWSGSALSLQLCLVGVLCFQHPQLPMVPTKLCLITIASCMAFMRFPGHPSLSAFLSVFWSSELPPRLPIMLCLQYVWDSLAHISKIFQITSENHLGRLPNTWSRIVTATALLFWYQYPTFAFSLLGYNTRQS